MICSEDHVAASDGVQCGNDRLFGSWSSSSNSTQNGHKCLFGQKSEQKKVQSLFNKTQNRSSISSWITAIVFLCLMASIANDLNINPLRSWFSLGTPSNGIGFVSAVQQHHIRHSLHREYRSPVPITNGGLIGRHHRHIPKRHRRQFYFLSANVSLGDGSLVESGPWGPWSKLSECTRSCGGGVYHQTRFCIDTNRLDGSHSCVGAAKRYFSCNIQECPDGTEDFRANQCARFNQIPFEGRYFSWIPYTKVSNPCELNCMPEGERFYYRHARKVIDGTRCYSDPSITDICVDGVCVELGCDRMLGSGLKEDKCRVCGGDGSTCRTVEGVHKQATEFQPGYNDILLIPTGATNINIREVKATNNYLAVRNLAGAYYLNGDWRIQHPTAFEFAGTKFHYERSKSSGGAQRVNQPESLKALGPTTEPLFVVLLYQEPSQGIAYEYSVPFSIPQLNTISTNATGVSSGEAQIVSGSVATAVGEGYVQYSWVFGDYSACSRSCGSGVQRRKVFCAMVNSKVVKQEPVQDSLCDPTTRPLDTRPCSGDPCPAQWHIEEWTECSCIHRVQQRCVYCSSSTIDNSKQEEGSFILPDERCLNQSVKPDTIRKCVPDQFKCPQWIIEDWNQCDSICGEGKQNRTVKCGFPAKKKKTLQKIISTIGTNAVDTVKEPEDLLLPVGKAAPVPVIEETTTATENLITTQNEILLNIDTTTLPSFTTETVTTNEITTTENVPVDSDSSVLQIQKREIQSKEENEEEEENEEIVVDDSLCDADLKPVSEQKCYKNPCDEDGSVEWIVSSWSSCDIDCGAQIQTRQVLCSTRDGVHYPDEVCVRLRGEKPADSQDCTDSLTCSRPMWFTSEWSSCSVSCGTGIQTRHVFCGNLVDENGQVSIAKDEDCPIESKPPAATICSKPACSAQWFSGPLGPCTVPCGGGQRKRSVFCFEQNSTEFSMVNADQCKIANPFGLSEQCNVELCDEDQIANIFSCKDSEFGCCPSDGTTMADQDYRNCPPVFLNDTITCLNTEYGCCNSNDFIDLDTKTFQTSLALAPFGVGCPVNCENSKFGCCPDKITPANSTSHEHCPPVQCEGCDSFTTMPPTTTTTEIPTTELTTKEPIALDLLTVGRVNCSNDDNEEGSGDSSCAEIGTETVTSTEANCAKSVFGCCDDGWTEALGPNGEGCDGSIEAVQSDFLTSTISSVLNMFSTFAPMVTNTATETDQVEITTTSVIDELDCNQTEFGCCPNGQKKAIGPRYYGCTCEDFPFGCCQDSFTPASGSNFEGCICSRMLYGCCQDGETPATGPEMQGCSCDTSPYGCCPDMVTAAQGPNYYGCPCDTLVFGCCPGSNVPAKGPDFAGCTCAETPFGCCADGVTVAYGPKFEGCPSGPSLDTKLASEVCSLPMEVGSCRNFSVKWFFDVNYGGCNRFWYGGCEGNGNRFPSQELCERACVKPEGPERCTLPKISGPCNSSTTAYYYNSITHRCEDFLYGGCLGNTNRFETMEQCVQTCIYQETALNMCEQPVSQGTCRGNYRRWYYRKEEGRCREFIYGGCQGNLNNFQTEVECQNACASQTPFEVCSLPKAEGPCLGNFPRWNFDSNSGICREFVYSGCQGNKNRFVDRESCENLCNQTIGEYRNQYDIGSQHQTGMGGHVYTGDNEIDSYESVCALPKAVGPCGSSIIQWYFDMSTKRCERFFYGGCEGNANRFNDREQCEQTCLYRGPAVEQDPCLEPKESGNCFDYRERWFYDVEDRRCHRFYYSGCGANRNNFITMEECNVRCEQPRRDISSSTETSVAVGHFQVEHCFKQFDMGPCNDNEIRWYYDRRDGVCREFVYGGCGGNENRFDSQFECQSQCFNSQDICQLAPARGSCSANFTQWFYDSKTNECHEFQFSGCHGNANRFSSKEGCETQCKNTHETHETNLVQQTNYNLPDQCSLPRNPGPCRGYFIQWYYSTEENQCEVFIYGGCGGNNNRFNNRDECESVCHPQSVVDDGPKVGVDLPEIVCRLPVESGQCLETQARWFYDLDSHTCLPFAYGGCKGNKNRFVDYEHCMDFCKGVLSREMQFPVHQPAQPHYPPAPVEEPIYPEHYPSSSTEYPPPPAFPDYPYPEPSQPQQPPQVPVEQPEYCHPTECKEENCILGIDYYTDSRGCPACSCTNPCNNLRCREDMDCALELYRDEITGQPRANAECRLRIKPGSCPSDLRPPIMAGGEGQPAPNQCMNQCRSDADCRQMDKCCNNGCADVCVAPVFSREMGSNVGQHNQYYNYTTNVDQGTSGAEESKNEANADDQYNVYHQESAEHHQQQKPTEEVVVNIDEHYVNNVGIGGDNQDNHEDDDAHVEHYQPSQQYPSQHEIIANGTNIQDEHSVSFMEGEDAVIDCPLVEQRGDSSDNQPSSNPSATPVWSKDGQQIVSLTPNQRFEILGNGSLLIRSAELNDRGTYACVMPVSEKEQDSTAGAYEIKTEYIRLLIKAPVRILPGPKKVIAQIGLTSYLQCNAIGYPNPQVSWWRGDRMLPLNSMKYQQMHNFTLLIRKVGDKDSGVYTCHAYNGIGPIAFWDVTLLLDGKQPEPEIVPYDPSLLNLGHNDNKNNAGSGSVVVTHNQRQQNKTVHYNFTYMVEQQAAFLDRIGVQIQMSPMEYRVGSDLELRCIVRSMITGKALTNMANVVWYANSDIPLLVDSTNQHHYRLIENGATLVVYNLNKADSGEYRCRANTGPFNDATASVIIQVENIFVPSTCQDSPFFAQCEMVVRANYCQNPSYAKFCCRSCYIANSQSANQAITISQ